MGVLVGAAGSTGMTSPAILGLSSEDRDVLSEANLAIGRYDLGTETERFVLEAQLHAGRLSEHLRRILFGFRRTGDPSGALWLRGVPVGIVPPTPVYTSAVHGSPAPGAAAMSVLLACLGEQYGFRAELGGRIVQDILPVPGFENQQISLGSSVELACHVETAFSTFRSDYVALLCLREDHEQWAGTSLCSVDAMLAQLDAVTILGEPRFRTAVDDSFRIGVNGGSSLWVDPICVLSDPRERPRLRVDFVDTEGKDAAAQAALEVLRDVVSRERVVVRLRAGDLLVIDNNRAVHGRTPFFARYDGADRWLLRSFVTRDLHRSEHVRPGDRRIVDFEHPV